MYFPDGTPRPSTYDNQNFSLKVEMPSAEHSRVIAPNFEGWSSILTEITNLLDMPQ